ncbi:ChbG/HpnK family deacetylase [Rhodopseudomonas sp. HC1]|uniref:ChbG/HpnK family deacetylase n=1 Tax=Rhodopseudomonas infernalis TaxID=2897386 RepID=UPI001EE8AEBA|nr:ChbG/HpnK family deacetylase [Rhodopseudomonas infernalis]MCG6207808.1 ChbG/HpnK family deacetylase [Rhodopseudomonas infernalis]
MSEAAPRRIWLCADDYGMSPGVNRAIRDLIARHRINATSVMMVGHAIDRDEVRALIDVAAANPDCAIGLHATLTAPFSPLTMHYHPLHGGIFLPLGRKLRGTLLRRHDRAIIATELTAQLEAFAERFGRMPDYVDGHQHVQLFPQVRDAFVDVVKTLAPDAWVRQCGRSQPLARRLGSPKPLLLDALSAPFRHRAARAGLAFNPGFSGAYDFARDSDFESLMASFLDGLPDRGLVMCHPGFVDDVLISLDPFTGQREREHAFLAGDRFPALLDAHNVALLRRADRFSTTPSPTEN